MAVAVAVATAVAANRESRPRQRPQWRRSYDCPRLGLGKQRV